MSSRRSRDSIRSVPRSGRRRSTGSHIAHVIIIAAVRSVPSGPARRRCRPGLRRGHAPANLALQRTPATGHARSGGARQRPGPLSSVVSRRKSQGTPPRSVSGRRREYSTQVGPSLRAASGHRIERRSCHHCRRRDVGAVGSGQPPMPVAACVASSRRLTSRCSGPRPRDTLCRCDRPPNVAGSAELRR